MKIVIDIPDSIYNEIKDSEDLFRREPKNIILCAILDGTPLPKGHGRLIDADALNTRMNQRMEKIGDDESIWETSNVATALELFAPTIIEADKETDDYYRGAQAEI